MENLNDVVPSSSKMMTKEECFTSPTSHLTYSAVGETSKFKLNSKSKELDKDTEEYIRRRKRNNEAVKKSREKTKERTMSTLQKVEQLKSENQQLETKVEILQKELSILKDLFMEHARGFCTDQKEVKFDQTQLEDLLGCKFKENFSTGTSTDGTEYTNVQENDVKSEFSNNKQ